MLFVRLAPLLAGLASAQYAITDLIGKDKGRAHNGVKSVPAAQAGVNSMPMPATSMPMPAASPVPATQQVVNSMPTTPQLTPQFESRAPAPITNPNQGVQPRGWGSPVAPRPANPPTQTNAAANAMQSLLGSIGNTMGSPPVSPTAPSWNGKQHVNSQVLSQDSMAVVSGLVEAFMHKVELQPGEKACLEHNVAQLTGDVMGTVGDIVTAIKALIAGKGNIAKESSGSLVSAGLDAAMKITSLVTLSTQLIKNCVHGDALAMLKETAHHLANATYLEHRFLVNGIDIAHDLSDAIIAFESFNFRRFGNDIGTSLRKILLSRAEGSAKGLPEGVPEEVIIQKATDGLMRGFFVSGSSVDITDTMHPDVDIHINLHQCIAGNSEFFKELWMSAWDLIAQISANGLKGFSLPGMPGSQSGQKGQPKWSGELMIAMMQFPMALTKCGLSMDMQNMFMEAIKSLNDVKVKFHFPEDRVQTQDVTEKMAKAVEEWTNWNFEQFGYELGKLFRELVMLAFPRKYSVDASGRLRRYSNIQATSEGQKTSSVPAIAFIGGAAVSSMLVALAAVRVRRSSTHLLLDREPLADIEEDGDARLMVE